MGVVWKSPRGKQPDAYLWLFDGGGMHGVALVSSLGGTPTVGGWVRWLRGDGFLLAIISDEPLAAVIPCHVALGILMYLIVVKRSVMRL